MNGLHQGILSNENLEQDINLGATCGQYATSITLSCTQKPIDLLLPQFGTADYVIFSCCHQIPILHQILWAGSHISSTSFNHYAHLQVNLSE
jgi:hypothetical protein